MRAQADKKRSERQFVVGDLVYLKLQPYIQTSVAQRSSQKLSFRYFGPFKVLKRVGAVAYKLQLPPDARIHPVVHVSQLKQALKPSEPVSATLPSHYISDRDSVQPCAVLAERFIKVGSKMKPQLKVLWSGLPATCATWEHMFAVVEAFPQAPAWGRAGSAEGGIVTTHYLPLALKDSRRAARRDEVRAAHVEKKKAAQGPGEHGARATPSTTSGKAESG